MKIIAHDEDSLTNLLFSEIFRLDRVEEFLRLIHWKDHSNCPFSIKDVVVHQQLNLSEFGKPDATILVTDSNDRIHAVIVEAKLASYIEAAGHNLQDGRFNNDVNSCINNQLTLRYRAWRSLDSLTAHGFLTEFAHPPESPFVTDAIRRCKKHSTCRLLKSVVPHLSSFYLVALTTDDAFSPGLADPSHKLFPFFFDQQKGCSVEFPNIGRISWRDAEALLNGASAHFTESYSTVLQKSSIPSHSPDEGELTDLYVTGRKIVEYQGHACHLSCKAYSYALRGVEGNRLVELDRGRGDRTKYLSLQNQIRVIGPAPAHPIEDVTFWLQHLGAR